MRKLTAIVAIALVVFLIFPIVYSLVSKPLGMGTATLVGSVSADPGLKTSTTKIQEVGFMIDALWYTNYESGKTITVPNGTALQAIWVAVRIDKQYASTLEEAKDNTRVLFTLIKPNAEKKYDQTVMDYYTGYGFANYFEIDYRLIPMEELTEGLWTWTAKYEIFTI